MGKEYPHFYEACSIVGGTGVSVGGISVSVGTSVFVGVRLRGVCDGRWVLVGSRVSVGTSVGGSGVAVGPGGGGGSGWVAVGRRVGGNVGGT